MKKLYNYRFLLLMVLFAWPALTACSSSDAEDLAEDILPETMVRAIHLSPDAPDVDVEYKLIEVQRTVEGLSFGDASSYVEVDRGITEVIVKEAGTDQVVETLDDPDFSTEDDRTVYIVNLASNLEFIQSLDDRSSNAAKAKIRFVHASPDAPAVDVKLDTPDGTALFSAVAFKGIEDYILVDPGDYTLVVTAAGNTQDAVVTFDPVTLEGGEVYTIVALGTLANNFGVRVFIDSGTGDTFEDLTVAP